ncbi:ABC transporter substrate-binding protein [Inquilinus sp.]|jgi:iron(III) transport system substrate-binding protein|uniref:ABC transporter substrate-binding protein n=1 Tax=Inquilinus sp. TaxID=1932117 RepID=UPI003782FABA
MLTRLLLAAAFTTISAAAFAAPGSLMIYTSTPNEAMTALVAEFNKAHPEVKVEFFRSGTTEVLNKLQAEYAAGSPQPDVVFIADAVAMQQLKDDGRLLAYTDAPIQGFPDGFADPDKTYFGTKLIPTGIAWNTKSGAPAPTSWADLLSAAAKDQVIMASPLYSGAAVIHVGTVAAQPGMGWDYLDKLAANGAVAGQGNGTVMEAVATGQKSYGIIVDFMALNAKAKGSPVDFVYPSDGVSVVTEPVAILKSADDVADAKTFVNWLLSDDGQAYMTKQGYIPGKPGVAVPPGRPAASALKLMPVSAEVLSKGVDENKRKFTDAFGG